MGSISATRAELHYHTRDERVAKQTGAGRDDKIIFLDVDGVLHPLCGKARFVEECMDVLQEIVKRTGAKVVLSSSWRLSDVTTDIVKQALAERGIQLIGCTPILKNKPRRAEIIHWLAKHPQVLHWTAIDDMDLRVPYDHLSKKLDGHFVHTQSSKGLTKEHIMKAVADLNGDFERHLKYVEDLEASCGMPLI